jgi:hypothetical protein
VLNTFTKAVKYIRYVYVSIYVITRLHVYATEHVSFSVAKHHVNRHDVDIALSLLMFMSISICTFMLVSTHVMLVCTPFCCLRDNSVALSLESFC